MTDKVDSKIGRSSEKDKKLFILESVNLTKNYFETGGNEVKALRGVNFSVLEGEIVSIMGASGSGKTTLLNLLGGIDKPSSGKVVLDGEDLSNMTEKGLTMIRRHKIGFIFQTYNLLPVLSAYENIELPMLIAGVSEEHRRERTENLLDLVGLSDRTNHKPDQLSGGQKQRVAIARSLANDPSILLCDEPTGDLDAETGNKIMEIFEYVNKNDKKTIIIVTHDPSIAKRTNKTYNLKDGTIDRIEIHN